MLFAKGVNVPHALVVVKDDVIYVNNQAYDLASLEMLVGNTVGSFCAGNSGGQYSVCEPIIMDRVMQDSRKYKVRKTSSNEWSQDGFSLAPSVDWVSSGFADFEPPRAFSTKGDVLTCSEESYMNVHRTRVQPNGDTTTAVTLGASMSNGASSRKANMLDVGKTNYELFMTHAGSGVGNAYSGFGVRLNVPEATPVKFFGVSGSVVDANESGLLVCATNSNTSLLLQRLSTLTGALTTMVSYAPAGTTSTDNLQGKYVGVSAGGFNGKRRAYMLSTRVSGTSTSVHAVAGEYASLMDALPTDFRTVDIPTTGFQVPKPSNNQVAVGYFIKGDAGKNYIAVFYTDAAKDSFGEIMVFEENGFGNLSLIKHEKDVVSNGMRSVLCVSEDNKEWLVLTENGVDTWRWDAAQLKPVRSATIQGISPAAVGRDPMGRTWVVERKADYTSSDNFNIHVFPPAGTVAFIDVAFAEKKYSYQSAPIPTAVLVTAKDVDGALVVAEVTVELSGPMTFDDGTRTKKVVTSAGQPVSVPVTIRGGGNLSAVGSI